MQIVTLVAIWRCASVRLDLLEILMLAVNLKEVLVYLTLVGLKPSVKLTSKDKHCALVLRAVWVMLTELMVVILENVK